MKGLLRASWAKGSGLKGLLGVARTKRVCLKWKAGAERSAGGLDEQMGNSVKVGSGLMG